MSDGGVNPNDPVVKLLNAARVVIVALVLIWLVYQITIDLIPDVPRWVQAVMLGIVIVFVYRAKDFVIKSVREFLS